MPDENENDLAEAEDLPQTSLHAHDDGREEDVVGDPEPEIRQDGDLDEEQNNILDEENSNPVSEEAADQADESAS